MRIIHLPSTSRSGILSYDRSGKSIGNYFGATRYIIPRNHKISEGFIDILSFGKSIRVDEVSEWDRIVLLDESPEIYHRYWVVEMTDRTISENPHVKHLFSDLESSY